MCEIKNPSKLSSCLFAKIIKLISQSFLRMGQEIFDDIYTDELGRWCNLLSQVAKESS